MTTGEELLRAILLDPADDDLRFVYSDYLEESGDTDRANYIRSAIKLSRMKEPEYDHSPGVYTNDVPTVYLGGLCLDCCKNLPCAFHALATEMDFTLAKRRMDWLGDLFDLCAEVFADRMMGKKTPEPFLWDRGFVSEVRLTTEDFMKHAGAIFSVMPVQKVRLVDQYIPPPDQDWHWLFREMPGLRLTTVELPSKIFYLLPFHTGDATFGRRVPAKDVVKVTSDACVLFGRRLAGLETRNLDQDVVAEAKI